MSVWCNTESKAARIINTGTLGEEHGGFAASPYAEFVAQLENFHAAVLRREWMPLVGTMLQDNTAKELRTQFQQQVIAPQTTRVRVCLRQAQKFGLIDSDADIDVAVTLCTAPWYDRALAGVEPSDDWPIRTAALVWRAVGGFVPLDA